eukprot:5653531-Alexandrium_andersonii.AAC.1
MPPPGLTIRAKLRRPPYGPHTTGSGKPSEKDTPAVFPTRGALDATVLHAMGGNTSTRGLSELAGLE